MVFLKMLFSVSGYNESTYNLKGPGTPNRDIGISLKMGGYWKLKWGYGISCHRQGILGY